MWLRALPQVILLDGTVAKIKQPQAQPELSVTGALDHAMALKNHQKTMSRALMQLQRRGDLGQTQRRLTLPQEIQNGKCPVEGLNFIGALRRSVSHCGPRFRQVVTYLVSACAR